MAHTYRTNLRCAGCVDAIRPHLDVLAGAQRWHVNLDQAGKPLTVEGEIPESKIQEALANAGYELLDEIPPDAPQPTSVPQPSYYPLVLILAYLLGTIALGTWTSGSFDWMRAMRQFMAGFFLVFSFFKLLDLPAFAQSYAMYDLVAARWSAYGYVYPFLELWLGIAYLVDLHPLATNLATLILMLIGTTGVLRTLVQGKQVRCACLGTAIQLPVATATLIEDAGMAVMAAIMLLHQFVAA